MSNKVAPMDVSEEQEQSSMTDTPAPSSAKTGRKLAPLPKGPKHRKKRASTEARAAVEPELLHTPEEKPQRKVSTGQLKPLGSQEPQSQSSPAIPAASGASEALTGSGRPEDKTLIWLEKGEEELKSQLPVYSTPQAVSPIPFAENDQSIVSPIVPNALNHSSELRATPSLALNGLADVMPGSVPESLPTWSRASSAHSKPSIPQPPSHQTSVYASNAALMPVDVSYTSMANGRRAPQIPEYATLPNGSPTVFSQQFPPHLHLNPQHFNGNQKPGLPLMVGDQGVLRLADPSSLPYSRADSQSKMNQSQVPLMERNRSAGDLLHSKVAPQEQHNGSTRRFSVPVTADEAAIKQLTSLTQPADAAAKAANPVVSVRANGQEEGSLQRQGSGVLKKTKFADEDSYGKSNGSSNGYRKGAGPTSGKGNHRRKSPQNGGHKDHRRPSVVSRWAKVMWAASSHKDEGSYHEEDMMDEDFDEDIGTARGSSHDDDSKDELQKTKERLMLMGVRSNSAFLLDFVCTVYIFLVTDIYKAINPNPDYDYILHWITTAVLCILVVELSVNFSLHYRLGMTNGYFHDALQALTVVAILPEVLWVVLGLNVYDFGSEREEVFWSRVTLVTFRVLKVFKWVPFMLRMQRDELENEELMMLGVKQDNFTGEVGVKIKRAVRQNTVEILCLLILLAVLVASVTEYFSSGHIQVALGLMKHFMTLTVSQGNTTSLQFPLGGSVQALVKGFDDNGATVLFLDVNGTVLLGNSGEMESQRKFPPEARAYTFPPDEADKDDVACVLHLNERDTRIWAVAVDLVTTILLSYFILFMSGRLSHTLTTQVVRPIEDMVTLIEQFTKEPMKPMKRRFSVDGNQIQEVKLVEKGVQKFSTLVRLGFGEAGSRIIKNNMDKGVIQMRQPGRIIHGLFGSCDIRNLAELTEKLQAEIAQVLNAIAGHVHELVHRSGGAPTNRIGDSFLLVWKPKRKVAASVVADSALRAFITAITDLSRPAPSIIETPKMAMDSQKPLNMVKLYLEGRMPGHQLDVGCGLHYGWAVETAIGSRHKLEASYIGAQVNLTSTLQALTKQYGVPILLDGETVRMLSPEVRGMCRFVDRVIMFGTTLVELFTFDLPRLRALGGTLDDHIALKDLDNIAFYALVAPTTSNDFVAMFNHGVRMYLGDGHGRGSDWCQALDAFEACLSMEPTDGPSMAHSSFIASHRNAQGLAPEHWRGVKMV